MMGDDLPEIEIDHWFDNVFQEYVPLAKGLPHTEFPDGYPPGKAIKVYGHCLQSVVKS
jgi:hypothetical protein